MRSAPSERSLTWSTKYCSAGCRSSPDEVLASLSTTGSAAPPALSAPPPVGAQPAAVVDANSAAATVPRRRGRRWRSPVMLHSFGRRASATLRLGERLAHRGWRGARWCWHGVTLIGSARHFPGGYATVVG